MQKAVQAPFVPIGGVSLRFTFVGTRLLRLLIGDAVVVEICS